MNTLPHISHRLFAAAIKKMDGTAPRTAPRSGASKGRIETAKDIPIEVLAAANQNPSPAARLLNVRPSRGGP